MTVGLFCGTRVLHARVYLRWGAAARSRSAIESAGGKAAYEAPVNVNGGEGRLTVFSFELPIEETLKRLRGAFPGSAFAFKGGSMATGEVRAHGHYLKLILMQLSDVGQTVVLNFDQTERAHRATQEAPVRHRMEAVAPFPGSQATFYAHNEDTNVALETSTTRASADEVQAFYREELIGAGWQSTLGKPLPLPQGHQAMQTYLKDGKLCLIHVMRSPAFGESRITVLHKRHDVR